MQFALLLPILFIVDSTLPIQEEIQNLLFPLVLCALAAVTFWKMRKTCSPTFPFPLWGWLFGVVFLFWALLRIHQGYYNSDSSLLILASLLAVMCVGGEDKPRFFLWMGALVAIQGVAWLEVVGLRLYGEKTISAITSVFNQKNHFQLFNLPLAVAGLSILWNKSRSAKLWGVVFMLSACALCILSDSDAGVVALLGALLAVVWFRWIRNPWLHWIPVVAVLGWMYIPFWGVWLLNYADGNLSVLSRLAIWDSSVRAIQASPWVGHGFGAFQSVIRDYYTQIPELTKFTETGLVGVAHNHFVHTWLELGLFGFALEQGLMVGAVIGLWRWALRQGGEAWSWLGIAIYIVLFISITSPSQVFFSARIGVWIFFVLSWVQIGKQKTHRLISMKWVQFSFVIALLLVLVSWRGEERRIASWRAMAPEIVSGRVDQNRLGSIPQALDADSRNPYALWYMANGFYSAGELGSCLQVLERLDSVSGRFFDTEKFRKKCSP